MDWEDVKTFLAVEREGSVRAAARALRIHYSTISRRIERLERSTGVRLFDRRPEGFSLTEAGEQLLCVAEKVSTELGEVERSIAGRDAGLAGRVVLAAAEPVVVHALAPRLPAFLDRYPGLDLAIAIGIEFSDIARGEADIGIRMNNNPPLSLVGKRLFPFYETIYAAPGYVADRDLAERPEEARWIGRGDDDLARPTWTEGTGFERTPVWRGFASIAAQIAAAKAGIGLAMLPCFVGDREPGLVRVGPKDPRPALDIWLLTRPDLRRTARIRAVMRFAEQAMRACEADFTGKGETVE